MLLSNVIDKLTELYRIHGDLLVDVETENECEDVASIEVTEGMFATLRGTYA